MRNRMYVHLVWTTRDRQPLINAARASYLADNLEIIARQERAVVLGLGIVSTHLHLLLHLHAGTSIPKMVQRMKGGTSAALNAPGCNKSRKLLWAKGYSLASISERALPAVYAYVSSQPAHHPLDAIPGWRSRAPERLSCDDLVALVMNVSPEVPPPSLCSGSG